MPVPTEKSRVVHFGVFEVDLQEAELRKSGVRIKLQDQTVQILTMLLERPGETVTREELRKRLWPADTFVVGRQMVRHLHSVALRLETTKKLRALHCLI